MYLNTKWPVSCMASQLIAMVHHLIYLYREACLIQQPAALLWAGYWPFFREVAALQMDCNVLVLRSFTWAYYGNADCSRKVAALLRQVSLYAVVEVIRISVFRNCTIL